ncbi:MAG: hypothetical protein ACE5GJ_00885 [Gemmatimonadota bacterium]
MRPSPNMLRHRRRRPLVPKRPVFAYLLPVAALALLFLPPARAEAQRPGRRGPQPSESPAWSAIQLGARVGYDDNSNGTVLGGQIRVPVVPGGWLELIPSGDITFLPRLKEYQFNADLVYILGQRSNGLYLGGGLAVRNTIFEGPGRESRTGSNLVVGLVSRAADRRPFGFQLELRYSFLNAAFRPRILTFGVNFPLWK